MHQSILLHSDLVLRDKYELTQKYMYITLALSMKCYYSDIAGVIYSFFQRYEAFILTISKNYRNYFLYGP